MNIEIIKPDYPKSITKHNERQRKKLSICQYGDAMIDFIFDYKHKDTLLEWWDFQYITLGEDFNCEMYIDLDVIHVMFLEGVPFYKTTKKAKKQNPSVQDDPETYSSFFQEMLPKQLGNSFEKVVITDWDFCEHLGKDYHKTLSQNGYSPRKSLSPERHL
jgi:hypothetical protein